MIALSVRSNSDEIKTIERFLLGGLEEEKRKLKYALNLTIEKIRKFEKRFGISTDEFLRKFKSGEIEENEKTFEWWGEKKLADELKENLETMVGITVCQQ